MADSKRQKGFRAIGHGIAALAALSVTGILAPSPAAAGPREGYFSGSDLLCLALNVYHEARNQPIEGQLAVAHVTLNRLEAGKLLTVCDVVFKSGYFSWTKDRRKRAIDPSKFAKRAADKAAWETAQRVARTALTDPDDDPVKGSTYFHTATSAPDWVPDMVRVTRIGDHVFYRDPHAASTQLANAAQ